MKISCGHAAVNFMQVKKQARRHSAFCVGSHWHYAEKALFEEEMSRNTLSQTRSYASAMPKGSGCGEENTNMR